MAMSEKAITLLEQIYDHRLPRERDLGEKKFVEETPDEALEYVLQEIVDHLHSRQSQSAPVNVVMSAAVGNLRLKREDLQATS